MHDRIYAFVRSLILLFKGPQILALSNYYTEIKITLILHYYLVFLMLSVDVIPVARTLYLAEKNLTSLAVRNKAQQANDASIGILRI